MKQRKRKRKKINNSIRYGAATHKCHPWISTAATTTYCPADPTTTAPTQASSLQSTAGPLVGERPPSRALPVADTAEGHPQ